MWNFFDGLGDILNGLDLLLNSSSSLRMNYNKKAEKKKKTKYFTEKVSASFIVAAVVLLFFVFKDPLPEENYLQTLIIISLIGVAISGVLFFLLYVLELYYFKSLFKLLLFSTSVILFFISLVSFIYFKSGLFL
jgi:RsiW-degrading membrane proteinase PrsW (M82 family)